MKLLCSVCVGNRQLPVLAINNKRKHVKSTVALCKHPNNNEFCIILFSCNNRNGTKYPLKNNIKQILTKFVNEGKTTIQFKEPPHDLYIQSEVIQLKAFLHLLKRALENKISSKELSCSSMAVTPVKSKDIAPTRLVIKKRSEYPAKGFPRTLEVLHINDINRASLDCGILKLNKLRVLNLSNNAIEYLPEEINRLPNLKELNISYNELNKSTPKQWNWLGGNLTKKLCLLDLSYNNLTYLPNQISKLHNVTTLNLNNNRLTSLPSGIGNLRCLKIFSVANNSLSILPGSVRKLCLQSLDLSNNLFDNQRAPEMPGAIYPKPISACSLLEYAAKKILSYRIPYSAGVIPLTLIDYLDQAKYCVCGKACFNIFIRHTSNLLLSNISESITTLDALRVVPVDCYFCSLRCFSNSYRARNRII